MKNNFIYILILTTFLFQGCATVTTGTNQTLTVDTIPSGATCKLVREGEMIGAINPTPGSVTIKKDMDAIEVSCDLETYKSVTNSYDSTFQGATLGNIILGGGVGVVVDAASGAMNKYPSSIIIRLVPEIFESISDRDRYYDDIANERKATAEKAGKSREYTCNADPCRKKLEKLNEELEKDLAEIEEQRNNAEYKDGTVS